MCQSVIVTSPLAPIVGRFVLGLGAVAGAAGAVQLLPAPVLWMAGALGVTTAWAAIATTLLIRRAADTKLQAAVATPRRAPARTTVHAAVEARTAPALPAAVGVDAATCRAQRQEQR
jgi:hypothetical protein